MAGPGTGGPSPPARRTAGTVTRRRGGLPAAPWGRACRARTASRREPRAADRSVRGLRSVGAGRVCAAGRDRPAEAGTGRLSSGPGEPAVARAPNALVRPVGPPDGPVGLGGLSSATADDRHLGVAVRRALRVEDLEGFGGQVEADVGRKLLLADDGDDDGSAAGGPVTVGGRDAYLAADRDVGR